MLSAESRNSIIKAQGGSEIMNTRVKVEIDSLANLELTISGYDKIGSEPDHYYAVTFEEQPETFVLSGSALTKLIDSAPDGEDLIGNKIKILPKIKTKTGRQFTPVNLI